MCGMVIGEVQRSSAVAGGGCSTGDRVIKTSRDRTLEQAIPDQIGRLSGHVLFSFLPLSLCSPFPTYEHCHHAGEIGSIRDPQNEQQK